MTSIDPTSHHSIGVDRRRRVNRKLILIALLLGIVVSGQVGCVALNIPSERLHDTTDHGGMFGDWRNHQHVADASHFGSPNEHEFHAHRTRGELASGGNTHACNANGCHTKRCRSQGCNTRGAGFSLDGGPLAVDPFDPSLDTGAATKPPEIPWPRFHPVPTRPVFGAR